MVWKGYCPQITSSPINVTKCENKTGFFTKPVLFFYLLWYDIPSGFRLITWYHFRTNSRKTAAVRTPLQEGIFLDLQYIWTLTQPLLLGAQTTILLFFIVIILAMPLGFVFTGMVRSRFRVLRWIGNAYITLMRGTPLLLQLFFIYFGLPILPVIGEYLKFGRFTAACIGYVLNYAAYFAEIYRGGLLAIDKGQYEACKVLGLSKVQTTMKVIIPQMIRVALPSIANESITLVKDTSLLDAVSVPEVLHYAKLAVSRDMTTIPFILAAIIYLVMVMLLTFFFKKVEKKFSFK